MLAALMIGRISLSLDVCLADDTAVVVILFAKKRAEIGAARSDRIMTQHGKLGFDFWRLHSRAEPASELGKRFFWRPGRREKAEPSIRVNILVTGLGDGRHFRQGLDPLLSGDGQHAQLAGAYLHSHRGVSVQHRRHMLA
jgi:hypothetical protein